MIATIGIGLIGWVARGLVGFKHEHDDVSDLAKDNKEAIDGLKESVAGIVEILDAIRESQRAQVKNEILSKYTECQQRGYITPMELETANKAAKSYYRLGGNNYIHALMDRMNHEFLVVGEPIPTEMEGERQ